MSRKIPSRRLPELTPHIYSGLHSMQSDLQVTESHPLPTTNNANAKRKAAAVKTAIPNPKVLEAIKFREEELKNDPNARYVDPHNVWCLLCDRNIKLSTKSLFDLSHWKEHRLKRHGIRHSSVSGINKPHTTRLLVEETKERVKLRKESTTAAMPSDNWNPVQNPLVTMQLRKYPSPSSSDTSSQSSSSGEAPRRSARLPKPSHRFNPLTSAPNKASRSSSRRRPSCNFSSIQDSIQTTATPPVSRRTRSGEREKSSLPLSSVPRSSASSISSLTSLSSLSSIEEDPQTNPLPALPDLKLPTEIQDYLRFSRWPPQNGATDTPHRDESEYSGGGSFPCWKDWSWSMLILPRWFTRETGEDEVEGGEHRGRKLESFGISGISGAADDVERLNMVPECTMEEDDSHSRSTGVGYMFFDQDASESHPVTL
ncbi:hypothetical protein L218DRAFT_755858 [Marasmius fiardii PR-910]|nr:hypothetical protein L218DRAFT_755858 [Marasmius fiardii PR-910]